jgi:hypothetical protein
MFMLQHIVIMPFIIMQQESIAPPIELQRFWSMDLLIASGQTQQIFIPSLHFSMVIVQRGTIIMFIGAVPGVVIVLAPMPIIVQSIGIMLVIVLPSWVVDRAARRKTDAQPCVRIRFFSVPQRVWLQVLADPSEGTSTGQKVSEKAVGPVGQVQEAYDTRTSPSRALIL